MSIAQIIPATGWVAVYVDEEANAHTRSPVAAWGLQKFSERETLIGLFGGDLQDCEDFSGFQYYEYDPSVTREEVRNLTEVKAENEKINAQREVNRKRK